MIDTADVFLKMLLVKDKDPCPCMSGRLFKDCHKLVIQQEKENPKKLFAELIKIKRKRECLYGNGFDCQGKIVAAHSVSKKYLRRIASADNHVYSFIKSSKNMNDLNQLFDHGILPDPKRIGINDVTTFEGLCEKHDNDLFRCFEMETFVCSDEQIKALHIRPVLKEIFVKSEVLKTMSEVQKSIGKLHSGDIANQQNALNLFMSLGSELSLRDLYIELGLAKQCIEGISPEKLSFVCFEIEGDCPVLCSSTVNPPFNLYGDVVQNYNDENIFTRSFSLNTILEVGKYYVLISWFDCKEINNFIQSFFKRANGALLSFITQLPFLYSENMAINICWYDTLKPIKRERLKKIFFSEILNLDSGRETYKELRGISFCDGVLKNITTNSNVVPAV